jgi:hypothetical protein
MPPPWNEASARQSPNAADRMTAATGAGVLRPPVVLYHLVPAVIVA